MELPHGRHPPPHGVPPRDSPATLDLLRRAQNGDRDAFARLYAEHLELITRYVAIRLRDGDRGATPDVVQDAFADALTELASAPQDVTGWFLQLAARVCTRHGWAARRYLRAAHKIHDRATIAPATATATATATAPAPHPFTVGWRMAFVAGMARLTNNQRTVIQLRYLDGYLAVVFGGRGVFAYAVWLMHSAARRRDALRAAGKLAGTAPVYGIAQWWREPAVTRRARSLALAHRLPLHESLDAARQQLRDEKRRAALATHVETLIRSRHDDPVRADIAATTLDLDAVAAELTAHADVPGWARVIGADLLPPAPPDGDVDPDAEREPTAPRVVPGPMPARRRAAPRAAGPSVLRPVAATVGRTQGRPGHRTGRVRTAVRHLPAAGPVDPPHREQRPARLAADLDRPDRPAGRHHQRPCTAPPGIRLVDPSAAGGGTHPCPAAGAPFEARVGTVRRPRQIAAGTSPRREAAMSALTLRRRP
ncbi:hypothetical protein ABIH81_19550 [Micromonospora sp. HUAS YX12]|uniref:RNA polymerase sigma-70 region 2 domain-containing protein n=1 Tax=Micromonospora sp. HUAS YX12 TaxID=3156396 RepID=A0AAU7QXH0_9ACTN